ADRPGPRPERPDRRAARVARAALAPSRGGALRARRGAVLGRQPGGGRRVVPRGAAVGAGTGGGGAHGAGALRPRRQPRRGGPLSPGVDLRRSEGPRGGVRELLRPGPTNAALLDRVIRRYQAFVSETPGDVPARAAL